MKWLTNCFPQDTDRYIKELQIGHINRILIAGKPAPSKVHTAEELEQMQIVGIYEAQPMTPEELAEALRKASQPEHEIADVLYEDWRTHIRTLLGIIDHQAALIEALKEMLLDARRTLAVKYPSDLDSPRWEGLTEEVRKQLAEDPDLKAAGVTFG